MDQMNNFLINSISVILTLQMRIVTRSLQGFANLNAQYALNKNKNAVRFESQNLSWDFEVVEYHCKAFAKGLKSLSFGKGDNLLILTPPAQQAEAYVAKVGTSYIDSNLIVSKAKTVEQLGEQISKNNIKALLFEPTLPLGNDLVIDGLYKLMPEIKSQIQGSQIKPQKFSNLKFLFQTNFYSYPGVFKYRSIFNYSSDENTPFSGSTSHEPIKLNDSENPLVITQPANNFAFKAGILNSLANGRYLIVTEARDVPKISSIYDGKIDLIATEECPVDSTAFVYVQNGSNFLQGHANRIQHKN